MLPTPEQNPNPIRIEELASTNLRYLAGFARHQAHQRVGFATILLRSPGGGAAFSIPADCDPHNRAMLDKLYELSHAEGERKVVEHRTAPDSYTRMTLVPTMHHFSFVEHYVRHGDWETFEVTYSGTTPEYFLPGSEETPRRSPPTPKMR